MDGNLSNDQLLEIERACWPFHDLKVCQTVEATKELLIEVKSLQKRFIGIAKRKSAQECEDAKWETPKQKANRKFQLNNQHLAGLARSSDQQTRPRPFSAAPPAPRAGGEREPVHEQGRTRVSQPQLQNQPDAPP